MSESKLWAAGVCEGDGGEDERADIELLVACGCEVCGEKGEGAEW